MNRRQFLGVSTFPFISATQTPIASGPKGGIGLTVKEWLALYGDPDQVYKMTDLLDGTTRFQNFYIRSDYQFVVYQPLNDPEMLINGIMLQPKQVLGIEEFALLAKSFVPDDALMFGSGLETSQSGDSTADYSSAWLKKRVLYEQGPSNDGTFRIRYKRGRAASGMYEWAQIGTGTYWII